MKMERKMAVLVLVVFIPFILIFTHAVDVKADSFVGFSSATATGDSGIMELNRLCQISFTGSHMCTTNELMNSVNKGNKTPSAGTAWIKPFMIFYYQPSFAVVDIAGFEGEPRYLSCHGWTDVYDTGSAIDATGKFSRQACNNSLNIACCGVKK